MVKAIKNIIMLIVLWVIMIVVSVFMPILMLFGFKVKMNVIKG